MIPHALGGIVLILLALSLAPAVRAQTQTPREQFSAYTEQILTVLRDTSLREIDSPEKLQAAVRKTAIRMFGVTEAARAALGAHWEARTPAEQDDFTDLLADFLEAAYIVQLQKQGSLKLRYVAETIDDDRAAVRLKVLTQRDIDVDIEARLVRRGERWLIADVRLAGVSVVENYRAQFDRIIRRSGYAEVVRLLQARRDALSKVGRIPP
jgi:phospholipid transport system substrate-binding protein